VPVLINVTGIAQGVTPLFLVIAGIGTIVGIYLGGRAADWRLMPSLLAILFAQAVVAAILLLAMHQPVAMAITMFIYGGLGFAFNSPVSSRILNAARAAPNLASTLVSTAFNIGIAGGAWVGALWIDHGFGYATLPIVAIGCSLAAAATAALSWRLDRRAARSEIK
jgi:DHA1 family inner membrane transport protein